ncbi:flagellar protein FlgN [Anaerotignum sp.]|uniref:flagellar protein FlgN n=1 Tax=Anaerotignum sp. TaxID=2039241 RepID=UPI0028B15A9B|nr:flagellar protein FlgN [Anaerotignum sp.]
MPTISNFNNIVLSLIELLETLITIEQDKLKAISTNDLDALNSCIKNEQVEVLKLRGLDKKREQIQAELGYENLTFREIIKLLPEDQQAESKKLFITLQQTTDQFNEINSSIKTALDVNLHSINTTLSKLNINLDNAQNQIPTGSNLKNRFA